MKLLKDLGMIYASETSLKKSRYGLYECPDCLKSVKKATGTVRHYESKGRIVKCKRCSQLNNTNGTIHDVASYRLLHIHSNMMRRCYAKTHLQYARYGGRDIGVCKIWQDFNNWKKWAIANKHIKGYDMHRINENGDYEPSNVKILTRAEHMRLHRNNKFPLKDNK